VKIMIKNERIAKNVKFLKNTRETTKSRRILLLLIIIILIIIVQK